MQTLGTYCWFSNCFKCIYANVTSYILESKICTKEGQHLGKFRFLRTKEESSSRINSEEQFRSLKKDIQDEIYTHCSLTPCLHFLYIYMYFLGQYKNIVSNKVLSMWLMSKYGPRKHINLLRKTGNLCILKLRYIQNFF